MRETRKILVGAGKWLGQVSFPMAFVLFAL